MTSLLHTDSDHICWLTLNRPEKHNAFDEHLIQSLIQALKEAIRNDTVRVIVLKSQGKHFSAGADLNWMQRMAKGTYEENEKDAYQLATLLDTLYHCPKPTVAQIQGAAYGGGVGLIAACDIAIAEETARFCFSEVKLGLIPAVISPYVIQAIGGRVARQLFMTGDVFSSELALRVNLIHEVVGRDSLSKRVLDLATTLAHLPVEAVKACKALVETVGDQPLDQKLMQTTSELIARKRQSGEAQVLIEAFLDQER